MRSERCLPDGRVELVDTRRIALSAFYNHDLALVPLSRRTWTTYNYTALWVSMTHCIPTWFVGFFVGGATHLALFSWSGPLAAELAEN